MKPFFFLSDNSSPESGDSAPRLLKRVFNRIDEERIAGIKRHLVLVWTTLVFSFCMLILIFIRLYTGLTASGGAEIVSLAFSDFRVIAADWREFGAALIEYAPIMSMAGFLFMLVIIMHLAALIARDISRINRRV